MTQTDKITQDINDPNLSCLIVILFKHLIYKKIKSGTATAM